MNFNDLIKISKIKKMKFTPYKHNLLEEVDTLIHIGGGIYRMRNKANEIIYVGKSNDIHRRLLQHIGKRTNTAYFIDEVKKIEFFVDNNPVNQTMLEGIFIAFHQPKYNDEVKDLKGLNHSAEIE